MATNNRNFLGALLLLYLISKGFCQCTSGEVTIKQFQTGLTVLNKPEWNVTIVNCCPCTQLNLKLSCKGFQSARAIDPSVLTRCGDGECLVNNGQPIYHFSTFNFSYVWNTQFPFKPLSSQVACS